ncbi:aconitate hydratase AcnA [Streptomyces piniterrae]|uniref:Aconitate hydratase n=1 Tax=Streptomyces piniterrae TaxID=2571125 RepID=A0A4U0NW81_9ACTN|nr:aconitate hydratase AcnA [Streptomyces piniterrae]TJZ59017.1 aconitate hydratase AcnA [Streptomyces piniterrae]
MHELLRSLGSGPEAGRYVSLAAAEAHGLTGLRTAPRSVRILVENVLRAAVTSGDEAAVGRAMDSAAALISACAGSGPAEEIAFRPTRLILQDHTGIPVLSDLASLRSLMAERGLDPRRARPALPVDIVVDHSVEVHAWARPEALSLNMSREYDLNHERYRFLRWAQQAISGLRVVPPGRGIVHQMNLEHLARVVMPDAGGLLAPDLVLGTDSHTPMVGALGVLGWGVGGIEAETALLGHSVSLLSPPVLGVRLTGELPVGGTATDLALAMTEFLRETGVVGQFVEFFGPGVRSLSVPDRATLSNMAPEYGCTVAFFPVDEVTLDYLRLTGRTAEDIARVEEYTKEQGLFVSVEDAVDSAVNGAVDRPADPLCARTVEFDLSRVEPAVAGPRRPQERLALAAVPDSFPRDGRGQAPAGDSEGAPALPDGAVALAAITSCTNTSNPESMVIAGLVARKAVERGLAVPAWVKTTLAPGSRAVTHYLQAAGLLTHLEKLGFGVAGFGCTTCIGNSGGLAPLAEEAVRTRGTRLAAVLSGNRNFEGRIHRDVAAAYLASPALVVAFALAGTVRTDLSSDPIGIDANGDEVRLTDLWPAPDEIARAVGHVAAEHFREEKEVLFEGGPDWQNLDFPEGPVYDWPADSTYLVRSPFFDDEGRTRTADLRGARVLVFAGDSTTTDHISPAGSIAEGSPAGRHLSQAGVAPADYNSYGCRRANHEVLVRGAFANPNFRNRLTPSEGGSRTLHMPSGEPMSVYDAAARYKAEETPVVILAGRDYGFGSSRDWAAKGPALLGVRAVLAESFERIHRSNLIGMGIHPLEFLPGQGAGPLGLTGRETFEITGLDGLSPRGEVTVRASDAGGGLVGAWRMRARVDTARELDYLRRGGFLRAVAAPLLDAP